jgi:hypothetical protein
VENPQVEKEAKAPAKVEKVEREKAKVPVAGVAQVKVQERGQEKAPARGRAKARAKVQEREVEKVQERVQERVQEKGPAKEKEVKVAIIAKNVQKPPKQPTLP